MPHREEQVYPSELAVAYWKTILLDFTPCHIPALLEGPSTTQYDFQEASINVDADDLAVQQLCSQLNITIEQAVQTAWAIVVGCYAGTEDVSFGHFTSHASPSEDTTSKQLQLCRAQISAAQTLFQTLADMAKQAEMAAKHRSCSVEEIRKFPELESPLLFNSVLQIEHGQRLHHDRSLIFGQGMRNDISIEYDVRARARIQDDGHLTLYIRTRTSKFSAAQTVNIAHTLQKTLKECFKSDSQSLIGDINVFSEHDFKNIVGWNGPSPRSVDVCAHRYFEGIAQMTPDALAIISEDGNFTYRELDTLASKVASHLIGLGAVPEMAIPFCFDKSAIAIITILGILKAGGAFVAIDPSYPASRIEAILQATKASLVVVASAHAHLFEDRVKHVVAADLGSLERLPTATDKGMSSPCPSNAAYMVFTSGSTGNPKGITVEHRALTTAVLSLAAPMQITSKSRVLQFAAYTFDASIGDLFTTLLQGGCICIPTEHERINDLSGAIGRMQVTAACLTPSVVRILHPDKVPCLETISCGGEMLLQEILQRWADKVRIVNVYGPSECTIWCTARTEMKADTPANNIGRALVGAQIWVADVNNHDRLCPIGCIGELLIEGPVLARGYLEAEQTKKAFVENPRWSVEQPGQVRRFYKTGDLVRYHPDGTVSFIGRKDTQVKVNGHRIELAEIEHFLSLHEMLRQSVVLLPTSGKHSKQLVGVLVFKSSQPSDDGRSTLMPVTRAVEEKLMPELEKVKEFLLSKLPSYMVPQSWVLVENIPLITSGKLDRVQVKKFVESLAKIKSKEIVNSTNPDPASDDPTMTKLRKIWSDVFYKSPSDIGVGQDFASLGGDSLSAMDLVARCKAAGITITVAQVFANNTIRLMTSFVKKNFPESTVPMGCKKQEALGVPSSLGSFRPIWWSV